ncbi:MAG: CCA tRNA nucleotidyltransferase [Proteobacteria bacterium]|nr:CCA tRNA nucleotidyltransferase [Pseudomonadota bacterium]
MDVRIPANLVTRGLMKVFEALEPYPTMMVGGVVRDAILGIAANDVDIATAATPDVVIKQLGIKGITTHPTGIDHGTVTAVADGEKFEITTLRKDLATDGRHAEVAFTDQFEEDAARRDFTINAMYMSIDGDLLDFHGGRDDLAAGVVRFVGTPDARIQEDYLRILRFFRFFARFGKQAPDADTIRALYTHRSGMNQLSAERKTHEWWKLLSAENPVLAIHIMAATHVTEALGLNPLAPDALTQLQTVFPAFTNPAIRWACLQWQAEDVAVLTDNTNFALSNDQKEALAAPFNVRHVELDPDHPNRTAYRTPIDALTARFALDAVHGKRPMEGTREDIEMLRSLQLPKFPINAAQIMAKGIPSGPQVGELLRELENWWVESDFPSKRAALVKMDELCDVVKTKLKAEQEAMRAAQQRGRNA